MRRRCFSRGGDADAAIEIGVSLAEERGAGLVVSCLLWMAIGGAAAAWTHSALVAEEAELMEQGRRAPARREETRTWGAYVCSGLGLVCAMGHNPYRSI
jgi:hypothetical protein